MRVPRGVRKVSELITQDGRALPITEEDASKFSWDKIPDGTIKINPNTGMLSIKVKGQSDWIPAGIKNDGTISIAKDSMVIEEIFTIKSIDKDNNTFSYTNTNNEVRHMNILEDGSYVFELEEGSYPNLRNQIEVYIDDVLKRSPSSGGVIELSETRFAINEELEVGQEIIAKYTNILRIGNPYPRFFLNSTEPKQAETGDFWLDYDATLEDSNELINNNIEADFTISWNRISGKPNSVNGYDIQDPIAFLGHKHKAEDIIDLKMPTSTKADGGNADTVNYYEANANKPNSLAILNALGELPANNIGSHSHKASDIVDINNLKANGGNADTVNYYEADSNNPNTLAILDLYGKLPKKVIPEHSHDIRNITDLNTRLTEIETNNTFVSGMIIMWYGIENSVPNGWAICDGKNSTPDLRDKFIIGAGNKYVLSSNDKNKEIILQENNSDKNNLTYYALFYIMKI